MRRVFPRRLLWPVSFSVHAATQNQLFFIRVLKVGFRVVVWRKPWINIVTINDRNPSNGNLIDLKSYGMLLWDLDIRSKRSIFYFRVFNGQTNPVTNPLSRIQSVCWLLESHWRDFLETQSCSKLLCCLAHSERRGRSIYLLRILCNSLPIPGQQATQDSQRLTRG